MTYKVYVIGEVEDSDIPPTTEWNKIGVTNTDSGQNSQKDDDFYERLRALNQGNPRTLEAKAFRSFSDSRSARDAEDRLIREIKRRGYNMRRDITDTVGHGEWTNCPIVEIGEILDEIIDKNKENKDVLDDILRFPRSTMHKDLPIEATVVFDLFTGL